MKAKAECCAFFYKVERLKLSLSLYIFFKKNNALGAVSIKPSIMILVYLYKALKRFE